MARNIREANQEAMLLAEKLQTMALKDLVVRIDEDVQPEFVMTLDDYLDELEALGHDQFNEKYRNILQPLIGQMLQAMEAQGQGQQPAP